jgi:dihydropteroate synthase
MTTITSFDRASARSPSDDYWVRPLAPLSGETAERAVRSGAALPLAGGPLAFAEVEIVARCESNEAGMTGFTASLAEARAWSRSNGTAAHLDRFIDALSLPREPWAGFTLDRPLLMGIVNVTPDSFSDGGDFARTADAVAHGKSLLEAGADILDIGGESTRPGAAPVDPAEEIRRVEPVVRALAEAGAVVSIDTRRAAVMEAALAAGARIVNDVTALAGDARSLDIAARHGAPVALMHMQGDPTTMQDAPTYDCASLDVLEYLQTRVVACVAAGIPRARIAVDPGIGFGKRLRHNREILARLSLLHVLGCPILLGASRKSFISSSVSRGESPKVRLPGSLAAALAGLDQGVQILRVHDVAETWQAVEVWRGIRSAG